MGALLKREKPRKRGRANSLLARFRSDVIDFARWNQVRVCQENQARSKDRVEFIATTKNVPDALEEKFQKRDAWLGRTKTRAFECASMMLRGGPEFGGSDAVKASYLRVKRNLSKGENRYHVLDFSVLRRLGLEDLSGLRSVKEGRPFYNLTL